MKTEDGCLFLYGIHLFLQSVMACTVLGLRKPGCWCWVQGEAECCMTGLDRQLWECLTDGRWLWACSFVSGLQGTTMLEIAVMTALVPVRNMQAVALCSLTQSYLRDGQCGRGR